MAAPPGWKDTTPAPGEEWVEMECGDVRVDEQSGRVVVDVREECEKGTVQKEKPVAEVVSPTILTGSGSPTEEVASSGESDDWRDAVETLNRLRREEWLEKQRRVRENSNQEFLAQSQ